MRLNLGADAQKLIREQLKTNRFNDAEEVVLAGLKSLAARVPDEFEPGEFDALLADGERSIEREGTLDGDKALAARRARRRTRRKSRVA